jgi:OFA family oxalate/formate antiporter-like MFS transporter
MKDRSEKKMVNRQHILLGAVLFELGIGMLNANGAFTAKLCDKAGRYALTLSQVDWISSIALAAFVVFVVISGWLRDRVGAEKTMLIGGVTMGIGYLLGAFFGKTFAVQLLFIGIVVGAGAGTGFLVPFLVIVRWFPDKRGMALGLTASGFGFGAVFWSKLAETGFSINIMGLGGVQSVYLIFGTILIIAVIAGKKLITYPPPGFVPTSSNSAIYSSGGLNSESSSLLRSQTFYLTAAVFFFSSFAGFMIIEYILPYAAHVLRARGLELKIATKVAELAVFVAQTLVAAGCVFWGFFSDRAGRRFAIFLMCSVQGAVVFIYHYAAGSPQSIILFSSLVGFIAGGNMVLFMLLTGDYFGEENMGMAYAFQFPAFGIAALSAPHIAFYLKDAASGGNEAFAWALPFYIAGAACVIAAFIMFFNKPPSKALK